MIPLRGAGMDGESDEIRAPVSIRAESLEKLTSNRDSALHLAAICPQLNAFQVLVNETLTQNKEHIFNWKNEDGNSVLHLISASFSIDPSLKMEMLKYLLLAERSGLEERIAKRKMVSDLSNRLNDWKLDLEWYKKVSGFKNKSYYDSSNNNNMGFLKGKVAFYVRVCLTNYWEKFVAEAERTPWKEDASFGTGWPHAGTNYRRMVEPVDVAEYYKFRGLKHYETSGRSQRYQTLEHSLGEAGKPLSSPVVLVDTEHRQVKTVNSFLAETPESTEAMVNAMEAGEFTAVNVPSDVLQSRSSFLSNSHLKNNWPMKIKMTSGTNVCHLLLLIAALVSTITYHTAVKIRACKLEQGYNYNSRLISICQIMDQRPLIIRLVMAFNSIAFFLSLALLMIIFNELPLRPLLLVCALSMLGAYICAVSDLTKPT